MLIAHPEKTYLSHSHRKHQENNRYNNNTLMHS